MNKARSNNPSPPAPVPAAAPPEGLIRSWVRFWFTPANPIQLHWIRLLSGLLFLAWLLPMAGQLDAWFGLQGWFDLKAFREAGPRGILPEGPPQPIGWSLLYLVGSNPALLAGFYWASIAVLVLFTVGAWTRITAVATWVIVVSFTGNPATVAESDSLLWLLAFYLMVGYLFFGERGRSWLSFSRLLGQSVWPLRRSAKADELEGRPSLAANLALRLLQIHMAIVIVTSALHKLQFGDWWSGIALWFPLHPSVPGAAETPRLNPIAAEAYMTILSLAAYIILAWQIGFPLFAWRPRMRFLVIGGAAIGWLGSAFIYDMPLFGPAFFICCLSYVGPSDWQRWAAFLAKVPGMGRLAGRLSASNTDLMLHGPKRHTATFPMNVGQR